MLFTSIEYFVFLAAVVFLYWTSPASFRSFILLAASAVFYATWSPGFLLHLAAVLAINYYFLLLIHRSLSRGVLVAALVVNFLNLGFFKYFYFLIRTLESLTGLAVLGSITPQNTSIMPEIILPLAISFYTFQITAMHIDMHRRLVPEMPTFLDYSRFVMFFPHFIAGPIMRHDHFLPQLKFPRDPERVDTERAMGLIGVGVIKKVVIADFMAEMVNAVTHRPEAYLAGYVILANCMLLMMVYCDFSGYTDIARGSALLLGYEMPINFRGPLFQLSFQEHWQRWHLTLTSWLRDYLYIGLGGNRKGYLRSYINLGMTFFLGGLWHGAGWGFAIWGLVNGAALALERWIYKDSGLVRQPATWGRRENEADRSYYTRNIYNIFKNIIIFFAIAGGGVFFNAGLDVGRAWRNYAAMFGGYDGQAEYGLTTRYAIVLALFLYLHWLEYNEYRPLRKYEEMLRRNSLWLIPASAVLLLFYSSWKAGGDLPFVYFQF